MKQQYIMQNPTEAEILLAKEGYFLVESTITQVNEHLSYPFLKYIRCQGYQIDIKEKQIVATRVCKDASSDSILLFDSAQMSISYDSHDSWLMASEVKAIYAKMQELNYYE